MEKETRIPRFSISGSVLKMVAITTMLIDHLGAGLLLPLLSLPPTASLSTNDHGISFLFHRYLLTYEFYSLLRIIGRSAFPIFCFLLVEGLLHTSSRGKYLLRLLLFSFLSEIPFNLALFGGLRNANHQNVFFTLTIGLAVIWGMDEILHSDHLLRFREKGLRFHEKNRLFHEKDRFFLQKKGGLPSELLSILPYASCLLLVLLGAGLANLLHTDYGAIGVLLIVLFYCFRKHRLLASFLGWSLLSATLYLESYSFPAFLLCFFYNGKRGFLRGRAKYLFYFFYPLHLLLIYALRLLLAG
ncbi:MAG: hypothetical protein HXK89_07925 [Lachnospiraceae bacterium]|nr:hypothetical protein [Lachnospiraceae bacterium]